MTTQQDSVLLVSPKLPTAVLARSQAATQENLGIGYLAAYLAAHRIPVTIVDLNLRHARDLQFLCENRHFRLVGFSLHSAADLEQTRDIVSGIRSTCSATHFVAGGHYASRYDRDVLLSGIDFVVRGEGEESLRDLYIRLPLEQPVCSVPGLAYMAGDKLVRIASRAPIADLDSLPFPVRYNAVNLLSQGGKRVHVLTSRGCPGGCSFCAAAMTKGWRKRSASNVVKEISALTEMGFRYFVFDDDNYLGGGGSGRDRALEIASAMSSLATRVLYEISVRIDDLDDRLLGAFASSGVARIRVGVEAFTDRQLTLYNKRITTGRLIPLMDRIIVSGIEPHFSFIIFDPYVTLSDLKTTISYMRSYAPYVHYRYVTSVLRVMESAPLFKRLVLDQLIDSRWEEGSPVFRSKEVLCVWERLQRIKPLLKETEAAAERMLQGVRLQCVENTADYCSAKCATSEIHRRLTLLWLDILEYVIESVDQSADLAPLPACFCKEAADIRRLVT